MTKYEVIVSDIRNKIQNGIYPVNEKLPTEPDLCRIYQVSRITVKKAIDQLVYEGLVIKRRGAGTFVKGLTAEHHGQLTSQTSGLFINLNKTNVKSEIISFDVKPAGEKVSEKLHIKPDDFVYYCIRFRHDDKKWKVMDYCYMPINLIIGLKKEILYHSIYEYIENDLGFRIQSAHRIIRAKRPNEYDKKYLGITDTDPVLSIEQIGYLDNGTPFEYSDQHHIGDDFEFKTVSIR
ncbi:GntR family transcriptional regulator [Lachnospiraceae bacterium 54-53]